MKKYIFISLIIVFVIAIGIFFYFYSIWSEEDQIREKMVEKAFKEVSTLETIDEIDFFSDKENYYFIFGKTKHGISLLVWLNEKETHFKYLFKWVNKDKIRNKALEIAPNITILRINPGINEKNQLIYEILYEDKEERLGYQYFYLENGEFIKMYRLGKTR